MELLNDPTRLDAESIKLLAQYYDLNEQWSPRIAAEGIAAHRLFASAVFARFRGAEHDVAPARVVELQIDAPGGPRRARLYHPPGHPPFPTVLFLHGGGWSVGGVDDYDGLAGSLAGLSRVAVLSLDYRLAPEHRFPAALEDSVAALQFLERHGRDLGCDPGRLGAMGDSAGGNLAAVVAREAALGRAPQLIAQFLLYPMTDIASPDDRFASRRDYGDGRFFLANAAIAFARENYVAPGGARQDDPRISPLLGPVPPTLAPAFILSASHDPLRDEAHAYHEHLMRAGVPSIDCSVAPALHAFLSFGVLAGAQRVRRIVASALNELMERRID
jgi:acetyl esterase